MKSLPETSPFLVLMRIRLPSTLALRRFNEVVNCSRLVIVFVLSGFVARLFVSGSCFGVLVFGVWCLVFGILVWWNAEMVKW